PIGHRPPPSFALLAYPTLFRSPATRLASGRFGRWDVFVESHQPICTLKRERMQQDRIHDAKNCRVRTNPQCEGQDGDGGKGTSSPEATMPELESRSDIVGLVNL